MLQYFASNAIKSPTTSFVKSSYSSMKDAYLRKRASSSFDITSCNDSSSFVSTLQSEIKHLFLSNLIVLLRVPFTSIGASVSSCVCFGVKRRSLLFVNFLLQH